MNQMILISLVLGIVALCFFINVLWKERERAARETIRDHINRFRNPHGDRTLEYFKEVNGLSNLYGILMPELNIEGVHDMHDVQTLATGSLERYIKRAEKCHDEIDVRWQTIFKKTIVKQVSDAERHEATELSIALHNSRKHLSELNLELETLKSMFPEEAHSPTTPKTVHTLHHA